MIYLNELITSCQDSSDITPGFKDRAYIAAFGEIPRGRIVRSVCDRPYCIAPDHLFAGCPGFKDRDLLCQRRRMGVVSLFRKRGPKLPPELVERIRKTYCTPAAHRPTIEELAHDFHVSHGVIERILYGLPPYAMTLDGQQWTFPGKPKLLPRFNYGTPTRGKGRHRKLYPYESVDVVRQHTEGGVSIPDLCEMYGVPPITIKRALGYVPPRERIG